MGQAPATFNAEEAKERLRKLPGGPQMPLTVHLRQEIDRLNTVIVLTTTTLTNLRLAIAGKHRLDVCQAPYFQTASVSYFPLAS